MTLQLYWGDSLLPLPEENGLKIEQKPVGATVVMADGSMKVDLVDPANKTRRVIKIKWAGLSQSEYDTMEAAFAAYAADVNTLKFQEVDGTDTTEIWSVDVLAIGGGWKESVWYDAGGVAYYEINLVFTEALT